MKDVRVGRYNMERMTKIGKQKRVDYLLPLVCLYGSVAGDYISELILISVSVC